MFIVLLWGDKFTQRKDDQSMAGFVDSAGQEQPSTMCLVRFGIPWGWGSWRVSSVSCCKRQVLWRQEHVMTILTGVGEEGYRGGVREGLVVF